MTHFTRSQARNSPTPPGLDRPKADLIGMRLNKYLAHSGVASRRQAAELVKAGQVTVNGDVQRSPGYQIEDGDTVEYGGKVVAPDEQFVYVLLNKPKQVITTTSDEQDRRTVMDLLQDPILEGYRLFPVGRLDRDTTGLLLITNDGDVAKRLTHPSHQVRKTYHAGLDRDFTAEDLEKMRAGFDLEDGPFAVDWVRYAESTDPRTVALQIHIGRNRIVRRAFAELGYEVQRLDRVYLAGLTKKHLPRGFWRFLTEEEVRMIRHFS